MISGSASTTIGLPTGHVYRFVATDFAKNYQRWSPEVQRLDMLTPGPIRIGSRARQIRIDQGRKSDTRFQIVALGHSKKACFAELSRKFLGEYTINPCETGTHLEFEFRLQKVELFMRPFEKLIRLAIQQGAERTVQNIKRLVEKESSRQS